MKAILLNNWQAKIMSLLLAVAIWFLIRHMIDDQVPAEIPVPGEAPAVPSTKPSPPIPGLPGTIGSHFSAACEGIVLVEDVALYRLHWVEAGDFEASLVEYPRRATV